MQWTHQVLSAGRLYLFHVSGSTTLFPLKMEMKRQTTYRSDIKSMFRYRTQYVTKLFHPILMPRTNMSVGTQNSHCLETLPGAVLLGKRPIRTSRELTAPSAKGLYCNNMWGVDRLI